MEQETTILKERFNIPNYICKGRFGAICLTRIEDYIQQHQALYSGAKAIAKEEFTKQGLDPSLVLELLNEKLPAEFQEQLEKNLELIKEHSNFLVANPTLPKEKREEREQAVKSLEEASNQLRTQAIITNPKALKAILSSDSIDTKILEQKRQNQSVLLEIEHEIKLNFFLSIRKDGTQQFTELQATDNAEDFSKKDFVTLCEGITSEKENGFTKDSVNFFTNTLSLKN
jgi:uncharacterized protein with von Willebrand factor type A (vWA) domain